MNQSLRLAKATEWQIATCSKWIAPNGAVFLELAHTVPFFALVPAGSIESGVEVSFDPEFEFVCKVVSSTTTLPGVSVQIQWPGGRYLSKPGFPVFDFLGTGERGRLVDPCESIARGHKVRLNLDATGAGSDVNLAIYFEGVLRLPMVPK